MSAVDLKALRDRLAKATGPDRALDSYLGVLFLGWRVRDGGQHIEIPSVGLFANHPDAPFPSPTASLDAASTLEIAGLYVTVVAGKGLPATVSWLDLESGSRFDGEAATEPLARCLARLEYEIAAASAAEERRRDGSGAAP